MPGFTIFSEHRNETGKGSEAVCDCGQRFADKVLGVLDEAFTVNEEEDSEDH